MKSTNSWPSGNGDEAYPNVTLSQQQRFRGLIQAHPRLIGNTDIPFDAPEVMEHTRDIAILASSDVHREAVGLDHGYEWTITFFLSDVFTTTTCLSSRPTPRTCMATTRMMAPSKQRRVGHSGS